MVEALEVLEECNFQVDFFLQNINKNIVLEIIINQNYITCIQA